MNHRRLLGLLALALVALAVAWALAGLPGASAPCPTDGCDCETAGPGPIRQPANAWSSLALAAAGVVLLFASSAAAGEARPAPPAAEGEATPIPTRSTGEGRSAAPSAEGGAARLRRRPLATSAAAALALVLSGTVAFLFHAGLTAWAARLDGIAAWILVATLAAHAWWRGRSPTPLGLPPPRGFGLLPRSRGGGTLPLALLPWLLLGLGGLCWALGRSGGLWCRPDSLFQAHAAWHLLAAAGLGWWLRDPGPADPASPIPPGPLASRREDCRP